MNRATHWRWLVALVAAGAMATAAPGCTADQPTSTPTTITTDPDQVIDVFTSLLGPADDLMA